MTIQLINSAYQDGMANIPDGSVDLVLTDPPYGTTSIKWDKQKINLEEFWSHINRVLKSTGVAVVFSAQPFTTELINSNRKAFRYDLIWEKTRAVGFLDANKKPLRAHEILLIFIRERPKSSTYNPQFLPGSPYEKNRVSSRKSEHYQQERKISINNGVRFPRSVNKIPNDNNFTFHPTQKPLDLIEWLVKTYSNEGDTVFDPFAGSATTAVACQNLNRNFIGFEREKEYYDKAMQRLADNEIFSQPEEVQA